MEINFYKNMRKAAFYLFPLIILLAAACRTPEPVVEDEPEPSIYEIDEIIAEEYLREEMDEMELFLFENRVHLADRFAILEHDMPETYLREVVREEREVDEYAGFRVQIQSTRSVAEADSTRDEFRVWASEWLDGYEPEVYILFRQPYYRVRAGDFRDREMAIEFSQVLQNRYRGAWIVHDRIEPENVPADTTEFKIRDIRNIGLPDEFLED